MSKRPFPKFVFRSTRWARFLAWCVLGLVLRPLGSPGWATCCFEKALGFLPNSGFAQRNLLWNRIRERKGAFARLGNIYFLERFTDLKTLLCTYEKKAGTNIFFVLNQDHFVTLFTRLFPSDFVIPMRQIDIRPPETDDSAGQRRIIRNIAKWRRCYENDFSSLPKHVDAYFTCFDGRLNLMMIADILIRRGHKTFYTGLDIKKKKVGYNNRVNAVSRISLEGRSPYLEGLSEASGLPLIEDPEAANKAVRQYVSIDPATWPQPHFVVGREWPDLIREFPLQLNFSIEPSAVLYLEFPLHQIKGFDQEKTRRNIVEVLVAVVEKGHTLHIKPHPMGPDDLMINGTPLEASPSVTVWPVEIPVEYMVDKFAHVLSFGTSTIFLEFPGRKVVLRDLLVIKDNEGVKRVAGFDRDLARVDDIDERLTPETYAQAIADWPDPVH